MSSTKIYHLYVKTHRSTGMKYLGYTSKEDPYLYRGSGIYWNHYLDKHGNECDTEILLTTSLKEEITKTGTYYSNLWNIVESNKWANLKPETGAGGAYEFTSEDRKKVSQGLRGKKKTQEHIDNHVAARKNNGTYEQTAESKAKRSASMAGYKQSPEEKEKKSQALKGRKKTQEHIDKAIEMRRRNGTLNTNTPESIAKGLETKKKNKLLRDNCNIV